MKQTRRHTEPRYPPAKVILFALFRPVTAVRRGDHLGLGWAWMVHGVGGILTIVVLVLLTGYESSGINATLNEVLARSARAVGDVLGELDRPLTWAALITITLLIEASVLVSAAAVMSWCARDERFRASHRRALRRLFLLTPHGAVVVGVVGAALVWVRRSQWKALRINEYGQPLMCLIIAGACLWALWVVLRALGCRTAPAMCRWPARCEGCGYQLTGIRSDHDCPECGLAIVKTLGERARPGIATSRGIIGWLRQTFHAVRHPTAFGKKLHALSPDTGYRRHLAVTLILILMTAPTSMAGALVLDEWLSGWVDIVSNGKDVIVAGTVLGTMIVGTTAGAALIIAGLTGIIQGLRHGRNLMPAAIRAACYQSGFAVVWSLVFWCNMAVFLVVMELDLLPPLAAKYNIASEKMVLAWHWSVVTLGLLIYGTLVERATKAARYANW